MQSLICDQYVQFNQSAVLFAECEVIHDRVNQIQFVLGPARFMLQNFNQHCHHAKSVGVQDCPGKHDNRAGDEPRNLAGTHIADVEGADGRVVVRK